MYALIVSLVLFAACILEAAAFPGGGNQKGFQRLSAGTKVQAKYINVNNQKTYNQYILNMDNNLYLHYYKSSTSASCKQVPATLNGIKDHLIGVTVLTIDADALKMTGKSMSVFPTFTVYKNRVSLGTVQGLTTNTAVQIINLVKGH